MKNKNINTLSLNNPSIVKLTNDQMNEDHGGIGDPPAETTTAEQRLRQELDEQEAMRQLSEALLDAYTLPLPELTLVCNINS